MTPPKEPTNPWLQAAGQLYQTVGELFIFTLGLAWLGRLLHSRWGLPEWCSLAFGLAGFLLAIYRIYRWSQRKKQNF